MDILHRNNQSGCVCVRVSARPGDREAERCFSVFSAWVSGKQAVVLRTGSMGYDDLEPAVLIDKPGCPTVVYAGVTAETASEIIINWLEGDDPRADLALGVCGGTAFRGIPVLASHPLFRLQRRVALARCGLVDPESIDDHISGFGGYGCLKRALTMTPDGVIDLLEKSGLECGGNVVYTQLREFSAINDAGKTLVCHAFDGDIEAHAARLLLEGDPHGVLEGLLIAAYAAGASKAIVAVPAGLEAVRAILDKAVNQMKEHLDSGKISLESGFKCAVEVREAPNALYMRDKTALLRCLEGLQAIPALPSGDSGLLNGSPALILDARAVAKIPSSLRRDLGGASDAGNAQGLLKHNGTGLDGTVTYIGAGTDAGKITGSGAVADGSGNFYPDVGTFSSAGIFSSTDLQGTAGTKILTLAGDVLHAYTVEVPLSARLGDIVREIGDAADVKAVQLGGPTGVWFGPDALDKTVDGAIEEAGAELGFALIRVAADDRCMAETAAEQARFLKGQSCGKCVFCREGTLHLSALLDELATGEGRPDDLELLEELGVHMRSGCVCAFGRAASSPVTSALALFREEFECHLKQKKCHKQEAITDRPYR